MSQQPQPQQWGPPATPPQAHSAKAAAPAGWYDDGAGGRRFWDGERWTSLPAPPDTQAPKQTSRPKVRRGRTNAYIIGAILLLLAANQARHLAWDIFDEGRAVTNAAVTLAENTIAEFAPEGSPTATLFAPGASPCTNPPLWAPNRVSFLGDLQAPLPADTDASEVLSFIREEARRLGLKSVPTRDPTRALRFVNARDSGINVQITSGSEGQESILLLSFSSRCLPAPRGYRGGSYESERSLDDDWSERIGFQSGPLAEARLR